MENLIIHVYIYFYYDCSIDLRNAYSYYFNNIKRLVEDLLPPHFSSCLCPSLHYVLLREEFRESIFLSLNWMISAALGYLWVAVFVAPTPTQKMRLFIPTWNPSVVDWVEVHKQHKFEVHSSYGGWVMEICFTNYYSKMKMLKGTLVRKETNFWTFGLSNIDENWYTGSFK